MDIGSLIAEQVMYAFLLAAKIVMGILQAIFTRRPKQMED